MNLCDQPCELCFNTAAGTGRCCSKAQHSQHSKQNWGGEGGKDEAGGFQQSNPGLFPVPSQAQSGQQLRFLYSCEHTTPTGCVVTGSRRWMLLRFHVSQNLTTLPGLQRLQYNSPPPHAHFPVGSRGRHIPFIRRCFSLTAQIRERQMHLETPGSFPCSHSEPLPCFALINGSSRVFCLFSH